MSRILQEVLETAADLHELGLIDDETMREFEQLCSPEMVADQTAKEDRKGIEILR